VESGAKWRPCCQPPCCPSRSGHKTIAVLTHIAFNEHAESVGWLRFHTASVKWLAVWPYAKPVRPFRPYCGQEEVQGHGQDFHPAHAASPACQFCYSGAVHHRSFHRGGQFMRPLALEPYFWYKLVQVLCQFAGNQISQSLAPSPSRLSGLSRHENSRSGFRFYPFIISL
jgi:hypothetical protein